MTTPTIDLETALLDAHYQGDPVARFAWLGWCEDNGVRLTEVGITGVWRGTLAEWSSVGPQVVRRFALERVELVDKTPLFFNVNETDRDDLLDRFCWFAYRVQASVYTLPLGWYGGTSDWHPYPTRQDAIDDASRRAIRWAREQGQEVRL